MKNPSFYGEATQPAPESYVTQASTLLEIQKDNASDLYKYGIAGRAYAKLSKDSREKIDKVQPMLLRTGVYQRRHIGQISDPDSAEFGVRFSITEHRSNSAQDTRHFDIPICEFRKREVTSLQDFEDYDVNRVCYLVKVLQRAKDNGILPDISADLTKINDFESSLSSVPPQKR